MIRFLLLVILVQVRFSVLVFVLLLRSDTDDEEMLFVDVGGVALLSDGMSFRCWYCGDASAAVAKCQASFEGG